MISGAFVLKSHLYFCNLQPYFLDSHFYPFVVKPLLGKITHFVYGMSWVSFQWEDANVHQYRKGGSFREAILGLKWSSELSKWQFLASNP